MNVWLKDPLVEQAEVDAFEAEAAEREGDFAVARARYHGAAEAFAAVALKVPADHPNTRTDLSIAAVASFARAGDFGRATEFARRILAEADALNDHGRAELGRLLREYAALAGGRPTVQVLPPSASRRVRDEVRGTFKRGHQEAA